MLHPFAFYSVRIGAYPPKISLEEARGLDDYTEEVRYKQTPRGSMVYACPFCSHTCMPGRSASLKLHAYTGRGRDGHATKGCIGYENVEKVFRRLRVQFKDDSDFRLEPMIVKKKTVFHVERKKPFLHYVLELAGKNGLTQHKTIIECAERYIRRPELRKNGKA